MNIEIEELQKQIKLPATYVGTFSPDKTEALVSSKFPETVGANNAEQMLHLLDNMCYHPGVYKYIKNKIPSVFLPRITKERKLPVLPLLSYIAGPSNVFLLPWKRDLLEYRKSRDGLAVRFYGTEFIFPYDSCFANTFIESYGNYSWDELLYTEVITNWEFRHAQYNLAEYLDPYETYFIKSTSYRKLCLDLKNICINIENLFGDQFFKWEEEMPKKIVLVQILHEIDSSCS